jgi:YVTN family beta-propeller protein
MENSKFQYKRKDTCKSTLSLIIHSEVFMKFYVSNFLLVLLLNQVFAQTASSPKAYLLVANKHDDNLVYIDPHSLEVDTTITTGPNPHEIIITPDQRYAYLSNYAPPGNTISVIDLVARKHIQQIDTGEYNRIHGTAMAPDGKHAYFTAGQTGYVIEVDVASDKVSRAIPSHGKISHMVLVSDDGSKLFTANISSENVSVIDRCTGELIKQIQCEKGAEGMAFTPDNKQLWVANQTGGSITIIDLDTLEPVETFSCPGMPVRIHFTADGKMALIPSWTKKGELIIVDTKSKEEIKRVPVGSFAIGIELLPDESRAFVGCEHSDGLHVIDMKRLTVEKVLKIGNGPDPMMMWFEPKNK